MKATPRMPTVTLRMVAVVSLWNSGPLSPNRRFESVCATLVPCSALTRRTPESRMERINCITVKAIPAEAERSLGMKALICGAKLLNAFVRFAEARLQARCKGAPIMGQVATEGGGGGTIRVPSFRRVARV